MSLKPDWRLCTHDRRFDRYRNRVARLFRGDTEVGFLLVTAIPFSEVESGHLWWKSWSTPHEMLWTQTVLDGRLDDAPVPEPAQDEQLDDFAAGRFRTRDEVFRAEWMSATESVRLRERHFG
jgi:hypothetical protein